MSSHEIPAEVSRLLAEITERPEDRYELYVELHGKLEQLRAQGVPVPEKIERLERGLRVEMLAESQGR